MLSGFKSLWTIFAFFNSIKPLIIYFKIFIADYSFNLPTSLSYFPKSPSLQYGRTIYKYGPLYKFLLKF